MRRGRREKLGWVPERRLREGLEKTYAWISQQPERALDEKRGSRFDWVQMTGNTATPELEILLPVHNEGESIEATIRNIYEELSPTAGLGFIICEDGSKDDSKEVLTRLAHELPMRLNLSDARKGYSLA